jgi:hypothetical protein
MPFGVDLGTTNSSIAWADDLGNVHSLRVRSGVIEPYPAVERSLVFDPEGDDFVVGQPATAAAMRQGGLLVRSFKRRFDKQRLRERGYEIKIEATGEYDAVEQGVRYKESRVLVPLFYDKYSRGEVVAAGGRLLRHLLTSAEIDVETEPAGAALAGLQRSAAEAGAQETLYIGVPVTFGPTARRRLLAALVASGCFGTGPTAYTRALKRCRLVYEPLALVSTLTFFEPQNVVVFDYGGGTLDIAVLEVDFDGVEAPRFRELSLGGLRQAGDALDAMFRDALLDARPGLKKAYASQMAGDSDFDVWQADDAFANTKIRLSAADAADIPLFNEHVTRLEFENAIEPELRSVVAATNDALAHAGLRAQDVGTVLLTGGSSLIPAVQSRLREQFEHVDEFSFLAGRPGDIDDAREALTGVSRGLARFGFLDRFETRAACDYSVVVPGIPGEVPCLSRGADDVTSISKSPPVRIPVPRRRVATFALYSNLVREAFCGAAVDVALPPGTEAVEVRVSASRERFVPAFAVYVPGVPAPIAEFDLDGMKADDLAAFVEGEAEWVPSAVDPSQFVLTKPLALGDFVRWDLAGPQRLGKVVEIREISSGDHPVEMLGFDPKPYVITVAREIDGALRFGQVFPGAWKVGDVRLA